MALGVNSICPLTIWTVPLTASKTETIWSACQDSFDGPTASLARRSANSAHDRQRYMQCRHPQRGTVGRAGYPKLPFRTRMHRTACLAGHTASRFTEEVTPSHPELNVGNIRRSGNGTSETYAGGQQSLPDRTFRKRRESRFMTHKRSSEGSSGEKHHDGGSREWASPTGARKSMSGYLMPFRAR